jgi:hypothetical protein
MKKAAFVLALVLVVPALCLAENQSMKQPQVQETEKGKCPFSGMGGMMAAKEGMPAMNCGDGMCKGGCGGMGAIAPSDKGGVIVLKGDHLYKYDKDLNLIKKVEICGKAKDEQACPARHKKQ